MLASRGIGPGEVVAAMLPRTPELVATILGVWRAGAVYQPLFTAFGPKAVEQRLQTSGAKLVVTDGAKTLPVTYTGVLPDLFREGQGVITEGILEPDGVFHADNVLAKHDENYMPPEVAAKLKEQGMWRDETEADGPESKVN